MTHRKNKLLVGVVPTPGHSFEKMFTKGNTFFTEGTNPYFTTKEILEKNNIFLVDATNNDLVLLDVILYFGTVNKTIMKKYKSAINVYLAQEPPVVDTGHREDKLKRLIKYFDYILTWNDNLVDNIRFFKCYYIVDFFNFINDVSFEEKKLLVNLSGMKSTSQKNELYSERLRIIKHFETSEHDVFDLYGPGWENEGYKNYKGKVISKGDVYSNYKFALCLENQKGLNGYITEKIWDCFICKIIPIYGGSVNICNYIPKDCFVDYWQFSSVDDMEKYLKNIGEDEYSIYIKNIEKLLTSELINPFTANSFAQQIQAVSLRDKQVNITPLGFAKLSFIKLMNKVRSVYGRYGMIGMIKKALSRTIK